MIPSEFDHETAFDLKIQIEHFPCRLAMYYVVHSMYTLNVGSSGSVLGLKGFNSGIVFRSLTRI